MIPKILLLSVLLFSTVLPAQTLPHTAQALSDIHTRDHHAAQFGFAVFGDNRGGYEVLTKILSAISRDKAVQFGIDGGDLVSMGYAKQYRRYLSTIARASKPVLTVIGNHEIPWYGGESNYAQYMGRSYYAFVFGNSAFIVLDDADEKGLGKKQRAWLTAQLKQAQKYAHRFVFLHVPLYDPRKGEYAKGHSIKKRKNAQWLNDTFDRYHVSMVFASHIHFYFRGHWHQTPYIISGGGGAPLKHYKDKGFYHYIKVTVNGDKVDYHVVHIDVPAPSTVEKLYHDAAGALDLE